jgi:hypothetical protein
MVWAEEVDPVQGEYQGEYRNGMKHGMGTFKRKGHRKLQKMMTT